MIMHAQSLCHSRESGNPGGLGSKLRDLLGPRLRGDDTRNVGGRRSGEDGFTLVELMVVIVILGLLATVVVINIAPATDKAAATKVRADISTLEQGVEMYRLSKMNYPGGDGLQALVAEGFVKRLPDDPWGNPYRYETPGRDGAPFSIFSLGADGREGGEGEDADIGNW